MIGLRQYAQRYRISLRLCVVSYVTSLCIVWGMSSPARGATISTTRVASGFSQSLFGASPPGDTNRLFIVEKATGRIRAMNLSTGAVTTVMTVPGISTAGEQGLLGLAFDPNYASNGYFYVNYTNTSGATNVVRYTITGDPATSNTASTATAHPIIQYSQPQNNHNGGWLGFGPNDGYLYIASGDGGGGNDPGNNSQDITGNLLGKMLRVDVHNDDFGSDLNRNYSIPSSNPFVGVTGDDEIWSYGLRNPWRPSFDRETGDLYIADVGQVTKEEVNFQPANSAGGENYGWRIREGTVYNPAFDGQPIPPGALDPIYDYDRGSGALEGNSVTGGYVYRGPILDLQGKYFFADFGNNRVWSLQHNGTSSTPAGVVTEFIDWTAMSGFAPNVGTLNSIASFAEDGLGRLYIIGIDGEIFRIESDAFTTLAVGSNVSGQVSGGSSVLGGTSVTFDNITVAEQFGSQYVVQTLSEMDSALAVSIDFPLASEQVQRWEVDFFGEFTGNATLTFNYNDLALLVPEEELNIYHLAGGTWVMLPILSHDLLNNQITVQTDSFSPFILGGTATFSSSAIPEPGTLWSLFLLLGSWLCFRRLPSLNR